ncbi:TPA: hypothetical protein I3599_002421 [Enterobacter cloacae]|nr:hypothetical protein [Enterobacter cloacae]
MPAPVLWCDALSVLLPDDTTHRDAETLAFPAIRLTAARVSYPYPRLNTT